MRPFARMLALALLGFATTCAEPPPISPRVLQDDLQRWVDGGFPSLSLALATSCGVVWTGAAGDARLIGRRRVSTAALYGIGSITKTFVAVTVLQLVEEGKLRLDETPAQILGPAAVRDVPNATTTTLAQLLNHTSGIPSWEESPRWIRDARGASYVLTAIGRKATIWRMSAARARSDRPVLFITTRTPTTHFLGSSWRRSPATA